MENKREIRFRAWHNELKTMLYPPYGADSMTYCRDSEGKHRLITINDGLTGKSREYPLNANMIWDGRWYVCGKYQDVVWMQFTGLFDKNKKQVYEGDILKINISGEKVTEGGEFISEVKFFEEQASFGFTTPNGWLSFFYRHFNEMEVIGNIYETPNILNK